MGLFKNKSADSWSRERLFAEKYDWLLGCALRLVNGDRAAAEDLVQESFLQFVLAKLELKSAENIEPLLYTNLKFVHLAYLRRLQRYPSEPLPLAQYDFLELALRANASVADRVEVQNTLRRIVAYVCWRKEFAKSASLMILRYFHGYYPDEIVRIAQSTRPSVRKQLHEGREEASLYASSTGRVRMIRQQDPPELVVPCSTVPSDQLVPELRKTIFAARQSECQTEEGLRKSYQKKIAIPRELLAHIVSCERCLNLVNKFCGIAPPTDRYLEETLGRDQSSRGRNKKDISMSSNINRILHRVHLRFRDVYEHEPQQLNIVVNGAVLATQDVCSTWNRQEVRLGADVKPEFIQVISEQDVCVLAMHVDSASAEIQQEIHHEINLSDGRQIRARVRFTTVGALVQVAYYVPGEDAAKASERELNEIESEKASDRPTQSQDGEDRAIPSPNWWTRIWGKLPRLPLPQMSPVLASAMVLAVVFVSILMLWSRSASKPNAHDILARSEAVNIEDSPVATPGVICQKVRIRTPERTLDRTIYRDRQGRRKPKAQKLGTEDAPLQAQLASASVDWDNPLSPASYGGWRDRQTVVKDEVVRSRDGLLTLTTTTSTGQIASESLTLRDSDLHPIERTVTFRDAETVEIAELDYSVLPWTPATDTLFEPLSNNSRQGGSALSPVLPLSKTDLDDSELQARLVLNHLNLDTDDRVEVSRTALGIHIQGIVETDAQKKALEANLTRIPYVQALIMTFQEMAASHTRQPGSGGIIAASQGSAASPLEIFLKKRGMSSEKIDEITWRLLHASIVARSEGAKVATLTAQFGDGSTLPEHAQSALRQILASHRARLLSALHDEEVAIADIGLSNTSFAGRTSHPEMTLAQAVLQNQHLCEVLARNNDAQDEVQTVALDLDGIRDSINQVQEALGRQTRNLSDTNRLAQKK